MWLAILDQKREFEALSKAFQKLDRRIYEDRETPFGTKLLVLKEEVTRPLPSFLLLDGSAERHRDAYRWVYKNLPIDTFISTGVLEQSPLGPPQETSVFLPSVCLRSSGRLDFHSGPVLYEEMAFDRETQNYFAGLVKGFEWPLIHDRPLFAANQPVKQEELHRVIETDLGAPGWDNFSGDLILFARHFSVKCGCLKICRPKDELRDLSQLWRELVQARLSELGL
jgi:hypothetical protein